MKKSSTTLEKSAPARRSAGARAPSNETPAKEAFDPIAGFTRPQLTARTELPVHPRGPQAEVTPLRRVRFGYFKPEAREVHVVGSFNSWNPHATPLRRDALGDWSVEIDLPPGEHRYRFVVDGEWRDDPSADLTAQNPFGGFDAVIVVV